MADKSVRVEVRGLAELSRAFKQVDSDLPKQLRTALKAIAEDVVRDAAGRVPRRSGKAAGSIKARAGAKGAGIAFGGTSAPYFPWLNFGGRVGRRKAVERPMVKPDRYIYATIKDREEQTREAVDAAIQAVARGAGFETKG